MLVFNLKKGIGPVVASVLLLVVAVTAVVTFQTWFSGYSSGLFTNVEIKSNYDSSSIEGIIGTTLYIKKSNSNNLSIDKIQIGGVDCNISGTFNDTMLEFNVSSCLNNLNNQNTVITIFTSNKIIEKKQYLKKQISYFLGCSLDGVSLSHGQSYSFFNTSFGSSCYSQSRTCNDSTLLNNSNFNFSSCSTSLICNTDIDDDRQIDWICANYPMNYIIYEGALDPNDNNVTIIDDKCWLKDDKSSCESNFIVNGCGSGTVLDLGTGLCWERTIYKAFSSKTWANAKTYCTSILNGLGGHNDWRLPTRQEIRTILDLSRVSPAIIGGNNNIFITATNQWYWTISTDVISTNVRAIHLTTGYDITYAKTSLHYAFCVRN